MLDTNGESNSQRSKTKHNTGYIFCDVCYIQIKKNPTKMQCSSCSHYFCKYHLRRSKQSEENTCDKCFKDLMRIDIKAGRALEINEYRDLADEIKREKFKIGEDLKAKANNILKLEENIKDNENQHAIKIAQLEQKISQETQINCYVLSEIDSLGVTIKNSKLSQEIWKKKLAVFQEEINKKNELKEKTNQEQAKSLREIDQLNKQTRLFIPYGRLRSITCPDCVKKIKRVFRDEIISGLKAVGRDSLIESVIAAKASIQALNQGNETIAEGKREEPKDACHCIIS
ncbi:unnamed protein product [Blepharisma stoltei]|uniref:RING-type domain-containing protein n=1 Tax=Blepharisma stoltei TaxID=1481888 RepID=A0AAU9IQ32_9CILI|nr:unnamed protein product [Blepharisma stoltei]